MVPMRNDADVERTIRRGPKLYVAAPGQTIEVYRHDVPRLAAVGFVRVEAESAETETTLEDLTLDELRDLASEREISGRSGMNKADLVSALTQTQE